MALVEFFPADLTDSRKKKQLICVNHLKPAGLFL